MPLIKYRQHGNNQLGATITFKEKFKRRIKYYTSCGDCDVLGTESRDILSCYGLMLDEESHRLCELLASYKSKVSSYFRLLFSSKFVHENVLTTLGFKFKVLICKL